MRKASERRHVQRSAHGLSTASNFVTGAGCDVWARRTAEVNERASVNTVRELTSPVPLGGPRFDSRSTSLNSAEGLPFLPTVALW